MKIVSPIKFKMIWLIFFLSSWTFTYAQEDSLRSALNAIARRQRDLSEYDEAEYGYPLDRPDDVAFLKAPTSYSPDHSFDKNGMISRPLMNYIDDDSYNSDDVNTGISSAFRERVEEDNQKQLEELARDFLSNADGRDISEIDNEELLKQLWEKHRRPYEDPRMYSKFAKRDYYPQFGLDAIGLRKRSPSNRYGNNELENIYAHKYSPKVDEFDDDYYENNQINYLRKRYRQKENKLNMIRQMYTNPYSHIKRFPVSKRSSNYMSLENTHEEKRSVSKQTDPKVEKELRTIFGNKNDNATPTKVPITTTKLPKFKKVVTENEQKSIRDEKKNTQTINKEEWSPLPSASEKPLLIKKKSIDWSDYFGLDRRKKSEQNDLDKQWLIERYHKSIALPTEKRTAEVPLSSFRNHDEPSKKEFFEDIKGEKLSPEEKKIDDMGSKLKMLEDKIVDDALKYTGAHEGETDPKEIQDVKDKVISRLAEAYSLEKMRNALKEYKLSIAKERENLKSRKPEEEEEYIFSEEKRVAVPRKQVTDSDKGTTTEDDNNIKCSDGNEKCHEQNYRTPSEILDNHFGHKECPAIQTACSEVASAIGQYGQVFKDACSMHEMCLLCSDNSWFSPTRQCNTLFLAKAYDLCKGNPECQRAAQASIPYLLDVNRSLHTQGASIDDCDLSCPETYAMAIPSDTR